MYAVRFQNTAGTRQLVLSVVKNYAFILPFMPVQVNQIVLTQVISGESTDLAKIPIGTAPDLKHLALTVEGTIARLYFRGRLILVATLITTFTIDRIELVGGTQDTLHSEMVLVPTVSGQETIAMWDNLRAPFYDPSPHIDAGAQPISVKGAGGRIEMDKYGQRFIRAKDNKTMIEFDLETGSSVYAGRIEAKEGYFRGDITGASGTFSGDITGASGTFSGDITGATGEFHGTLKAKSITADMYSEIRSVLPYVGTDSLDQNNPIEVDFYIPSETDRIVNIFLSAKALRYRAYSKTAEAGGSHTHSVTIPGHTHQITTTTKTYDASTRDSGEHTHGAGYTGDTLGISSIDLIDAGDHSHSISATTDTISHSHTAAAKAVTDHTHTLTISTYNHTHSVTGNTRAVLDHSHSVSLSTSSNSHSHGGSISSSGAHQHDLDIVSNSHYHSVSGTTTDSKSHDHSGSKTKTLGYYVGAHTHSFTTNSDSHSHTVSGSVGNAGGHYHEVSLTTASDSHGHTGTLGSAGGHTHEITMDSHNHYHTTTGTTSTVLKHSGHVSRINTAVHNHTIAKGGAHSHGVVYYDTEVKSATEATAITVPTTGVSEAHTHNLIYNIALDTTPENVMVYCDDGSGYDTGQNLASAPTNDKLEYVLATERDLTAKFTGAGWKRIKFTSSRRGRITWQLIAKLDITA